MPVLKVPVLKIAGPKNAETKNAGIENARTGIFLVLENSGGTKKF